MLCMNLVLAIFTFLCAANTVGFKRLVISGILDQNKSVINTLHVVQVSGEHGRPSNLRSLVSCSPAVWNFLHAEVKDKRCDIFAHTGKTASRKDSDAIISHSNATLEMEPIQSMLSLRHF